MASLVSQSSAVHWVVRAAQESEALPAPTGPYLRANCLSQLLYEANARPLLDLWESLFTANRDIRDWLGRRHFPGLQQANTILPLLRNRPARLGRVD